MPATSPINFFNENIEFTLRNKNSIRSWLLLCVEAESEKLDEINFIFCSDKYLRKINKQYLNHDYFTDIITFPLSDKGAKQISGDIFISIERVRENAKTYRVNTNEELHRVMAHGLLHLCGYGDKSEKEVKIMRRMENKWLEMWKKKMGK